MAGIPPELGVSAAPSAISRRSQPGEDGGEDDASAVGGGVLVIAGGQAPPLLKAIEEPFHHVATAVADRAVRDRPTSASTCACAGSGEM
jgi:hypothetical protein